MTAHAGKDVERGEHSSTAGGECNCVTILEINLAVSQEIGNSSTSKSNNITPGHIGNGHSTKPQRYLVIYVHSRFIRNSKKQETTQMSLNRRMDKINVVYFI